MAGRNILIFSDGTGQAGGLLPDERRSNIYKLFRATRIGPDSSIDPAEQLAFYDPGLGTQALGVSTPVRIWRWIYNTVSQAMGLGLTANIIDCYAAILTLWEPGDRIYLFGFSRGAYTVRCLGAVLGLCGVPTTMKDGTPLRRDPQSTRAIADEAVKKVYQHVSSPKDEAYLEQRKALAARFRAQHGSDAGGKANAIPYFIGVFDTVAALGSYGLMALLALGAVAIMAATAGLLSLFAFTFWIWFGLLVAAALVLAGIGFLKTYVKYAVGLEGYTFWETLHVTHLKMKFYDNQLNPDVLYAKHALSIDENRADFARVPWTNEGMDNEGGRFEQVWFAGNHSDVGGSYPENESRLSDTALQWMVEAAQAVPNGIRIDGDVLQLYPSAAGPQHDECKSGRFGHLWEKGLRDVSEDAVLHASVKERFEQPQVLHYDEMKPYRPENLRQHQDVAQYYDRPVAV
ncbi:DUF2235 domain-containing protein [Microvirga terrestris]|uniref:DUF2235 domain-containing protein n=1 Tax=Microvirga terrestris TaxID=2791024 RepID=A0ABS0HWB1_9HYPH|nr:DUF2235 domain-containing protein [Microvirga terrestris]MBF9197778.1 DUF2235 domain-containing protein [Microvirga terrestris]